MWQGACFPAHIRDEPPWCGFCEVTSSAAVLAEVSCMLGIRQNGRSFYTALLMTLGSCWELAVSWRTHKLRFMLTVPCRTARSWEP